jgi:cell division protein FtsN
MSDANWGGPYAAHSTVRYSQYDPAQPHAAQYGGYTQPHRGIAQQSYQGGPQGYDYPDPEPLAVARSGGAIGRALHGAGALMSIALIGGLAVWGYNLAMRDVTGVPVVRALAGPMRIQPVDPGGVAAAHQGLAVNTVAAEGQAEGPAEQVALAPVQMGLEESDTPARPGEEVSAVSMAEASELVPSDVPDPAPEMVALADNEMALETDEDVALALADAVAADATPLSGEETDLSLTPEAELVLASVAVSPEVPGVARSPRPQPRPNDLVTRAVASPIDLAVASAAAAMPSGASEVDPVQIASGTRLVQLGAFDSEDIARSEWSRLAMRFPEMLDGKDRVIQQAQSGGKTFYRLRAMGFADISEARNFCSALMAGQAACIPVVTH